MIRVIHIGDNDDNRNNHDHSDFNFYFIITHVIVVNTFLNYWNIFFKWNKWIDWIVFLRFLSFNFYRFTFCYNAFLWIDIVWNCSTSQPESYILLTGILLTWSIRKSIDSFLLTYAYASIVNMMNESNQNGKSGFS